MNEHVQRLFAEHDKPTHCDAIALHVGLGPVGRLAATVRKQVLEYQALLEELSHSDPYNAHGLDGIVEHLHQTFGALEREATALTLAARELGKGSKQLERYMADARGAIAEKAAPAPTPETPPAAHNEMDDFPGHADPSRERIG
jgi:hypothetical protein